MPTPAQRIAALVAAVNASDVEQGRPPGWPDRDADDIAARCHDGDLVSADLDGHDKPTTFAVLTMDEAVTSKHLGASLGRDLNDHDVVNVNGQPWVVVAL